jgi:TatD DNase family protein
MKFVDTHTHLYVEQFDEDRTEIMQKAIEAGIDHFVLPSIDKSYYQRMLDTQTLFPENTSLLLGLHPCHVKENLEEELAFLESKLKGDNYKGIGEIGVDLYWDKTFVKEQMDAFKIQIEWAKERNMPFAIHCRDAFDEVFEVLEDTKGPEMHGVFHCFTGNQEQAEKALSYNLHLGLGGVLTFKNGKINRFMHEIPLSKIVLETDAPYLAPSPYRGKRNEPYYLLFIAEKLAEIHGLSLKEVAETTTNNALNLFKL